MDIQVAKVFAAAIALLPLFAVALSIGWVFASLIKAAARNPAIKDDLRGYAFFAFIVIETTTLFSLFVVMLILFG